MKPNITIQNNKNKIITSKKIIKKSIILNFCSEPKILDSRYQRDREVEISVRKVNRELNDSGFLGLQQELEQASIGT